MENSMFRDRNIVLATADFEVTHMLEKVPDLTDNDS